MHAAAHTRIRSRACERVRACATPTNHALLHVECTSQQSRWVSRVCGERSASVCVASDQQACVWRAMSKVCGERSSVQRVPLRAHMSGLVPLLADVRARRAVF